MAKRRVPNYLAKYTIAIDGGGAINSGRNITRAFNQISEAGTRAAQAIGFAAVNLVGTRIRRGADRLQSWLGRASDASADLETSLVSLGGVLGPSSDLSQYASRFKDIARPLPIMTRQLIDATTEFGRAGQSGIDNLTKLSVTAVKFQSVAGGAIGKVAERLSFFGKQIRRPGEEFADAVARGAETIAILQRNIEGSAEVLLRQAPRIAQASRMFRGTEELGLIMAAGARAGVESPLVAANAARAIMTRLMNPANFAKLDRISGRASGTFAKAFSKNTDDAVFGFIKRLQELYQAGKLAGPEFAKFLNSLGIAGQRIEPAFHGIISNIDSMQLALKAVRGELDKTGASTQNLDHLLNLMTASWRGSMTVLKGTTEDLMASFGDGLNTVLKPVIKALAKVMGWLSKFAADHPIMAGVITGIVAITFVAFSLAATMINLAANIGFAIVAIGSMNAMLATTTVKMSMLTVVTKMFSTALWLVADMFGLRGVVETGLLRFMYLFGPLGRVMKKFFTGQYFHLAALGAAWSGLGRVMRKFFTGQYFHLAALGAAWGGLGRVMRKFFTGQYFHLAALTLGWQTLRKTVASVSASIMASMATNPIGWILLAIGVAIAGIILLWDKIKAALVETGMWDTLLSTVLQILDTVKGIFAAIWHAVKPFVTLMIGLIVELYDVLKPVIEALMWIQAGLLVGILALTLVPLIVMAKILLFVFQALRTVIQAIAWVITGIFNAVITGLNATIWGINAIIDGINAITPDWIADPIRNVGYIDYMGMPSVSLPDNPFKNRPLNQKTPPAPSTTSSKPGTSGEAVAPEPRSGNITIPVSLMLDGTELGKAWVKVSGEEIDKKLGARPADGLGIR